MPYAAGLTLEVTETATGQRMTVVDEIAEIERAVAGFRASGVPLQAISEESFVLPTLDGSPWASVPAILADDSVPMLVVVDLLLVGTALALLVVTRSTRRRFVHTPVLD